MSKSKVREVVLVKDTDETLGLGSIFENMPVLRGSTIFMREGLYDEKKYPGIPVDRSRCK